MKTCLGLILTVLMISNISSAAPTGAKESRTAHETARRSETAQSYKEIQEAVKNAKLINEVPGLSVKASKLIEYYLKPTGVTVEYTHLMNLLNVDPKTTILELSRLSRIATSADIKASNQAKVGIELIGLSAKNIATTSKSEVEAKKNQAELKFVLALSTKISKLDYNVAARDFVKAYKLAMQNGVSPRDAMKQASNGKLSEEILKDCDI